MPLRVGTGVSNALAGLAARRSLACQNSFKQPERGEPSMSLK